MGEWRCQKRDSKIELGSDKTLNTELQLYIYKTVAQKQAFVSYACDCVRDICGEENVVEGMVEKQEEKVVSRHAHMYKMV